MIVEGMMPIVPAAHVTVVRCRMIGIVPASCVTLLRREIALQSAVRLIRELRIRHARVAVLARGEGVRIDGGGRRGVVVGMVRRMAVVGLVEMHPAAFRRSRCAYAEASVRACECRRATRGLPLASIGADRPKPAERK